VHRRRKRNTKSSRGQEKDEQSFNFDDSKPESNQAFERVTEENKEKQAYFTGDSWLRLRKMETLVSQEWQN
jgi:hypothetical protein